MPKIRKAQPGCKPERVTAVINSVAQAFELEPGQIIGPMPRTKGKAEHRRAARDLAMWQVRGLRFVSGPPSYPQIGRWFAVDHSTVVVAVQKVSREVCLAPEDVAA